MRDADNIRQLCALHPTYIGFIFYPMSKRNACDMPVDNLTSIPDDIEKVAVFVNETTEGILAVCHRYGFRTVQLHGGETPNQCRQLRQCGLKVLKAMSISSEDDLCRCDQYAGCVDMFVFDTKCAGYGGSGERFDHSLLSRYSCDVPFLLSGGISLEDASMHSLHPQMIGVDVNSRFELAPGLKDISILRQFIPTIKHN